jgi:hypothetical protein
VGGGGGGGFGLKYLRLLESKVYTVQSLKDGLASLHFVLKQARKKRQNEYIACSPHI